MSTVEEALDYIRRYDHVSFAELERFLDELGVEVSGDLAIEILPNLFLWAGMSEEFVDLTKELQERVDLKPAPILVYLADGKCLNLPIAKRPPKNGYKEPHWVPVTMRVKAVLA